MDDDFPSTSQEELLSSKRGKTANWLTSMKPSHSDAFSQDSSPVKEVRAHYFTMHPWNWTHGNMEDLSDIFRDSPKVLACWVSAFLRYNSHGKGWNT